MELTLRADVERALQCWRDATAPPEDSISSILSSASSSSSISSSSSTSPCRAWSHTDFAARVASFSVSSWFAKPLSISPLACARFGWISTQPDVIQCSSSSCARVLCMKLDAKLSPAGIEAVAATFASQLEHAHAPTCPWNHNASPASFTMLPVLGPSQVAQTLLQRIQKLLDQAKTDTQLHNALLKLQIQKKAVDAVVEAMELPGNQELLALVHETMDLENAGDSSALLLAATMVSLCGWGVHAAKDSVSMELSCSFCNRHVPLVHEEPLSPAAPEDDDDEDDKDSNDDPQPPAAKRQKTTQSTSTSPLPAAPQLLDPMAAHRWFCPWVVAQQRRDVDDQRMRSVEKAMLEDTTSDNDTNVGSITAFIRLPGWIQNAKACERLELLLLLPSMTNLLSVFCSALQHLNSTNTTATLVSASTTTTTGTSAKPPVAPQDALASIQSVLSLPESHF